MSESDRSRSRSPSDRHSDKQSSRKHRNSNGSDSDKSSYSEKFYSDDGYSGKNAPKKKQQNGVPRNNKVSFQRSRGQENHRNVSTFGKGDATIASRRVISANRIKVNDLRNKVSELAGQLIEVQQENRDVKRQLRLRERRLEQFEQQESDMPTLMQRQSQEVLVFREQLRRQKKRLEEKEKKLKTTQDELQRNQKLLKKMKELIDDKQLAERDELSTKLHKVESDFKEKDSSFRKLEDHVENLKKNHKHEMGIERAKSKETHRQLTELQAELERMRTVLKEKEKELGVSNIRANRQTRPLLRTSGGASTSPAGENQIYHGKPIRYQDSGVIRKGSLGSVDSAIDDRRHATKKVNYRDESSKENDREWDSEKIRQLEREREMEQRWKYEKQRMFDKELEKEREYLKELEKERELLKEMKKERGLPRPVEKERGLPRTTESYRGLPKEVDRDRRDSIEEKKLKEVDVKNAQKLKYENDKLTEKNEKKLHDDEAAKMKLERDQREREKKEKEEKERRARELEAKTQAHDLDDEEQLKQKSMLLAKMRAIDEHKLVNDKEFFLTTPSQNEFIQREKQMVANGNNKDVLSFGDYKPSFLSGNTTSKPSKTAINAVPTYDPKPKTYKPVGEILDFDSITNLSSRRN